MVFQLDGRPRVLGFLISFDRVQRLRDDTIIVDFVLSLFVVVIAIVWCMFSVSLGILTAITMLEADGVFFRCALSIGIG